MTTAVAPTSPPQARNRRLAWWRSGDGLRLAVIASVSLVFAALIHQVLPYVGIATSSGPLDPGVDGSHGSSLSMYQPGERFTYGLDVISMPTGSDDTAVITDVEVVGLDSGLRYLGARLGSPQRAETWQTADGWPPKAGRLHDPVPLSTPITSRSVDGRGWELFLGFQMVRPWHYFSDGIAITYEVNGRTYRYVVPSQLAVCTARYADDDGMCPVPEGK